MRILAFAFLFLLLRPPQAHAGYAEGVLAYDRGRFSDALIEFQKLAERGHANSEFMLGAMYFYGKGVARDDAVAAIWFHKAALQGNATAQLAFGSLHIRGIGVRQDLVAAYKWLTIAAHQGIPGVQQQAIALRDEAARLMRPQEVEEALQQVTSWRSRSAGLTTED